MNILLVDDDPDFRSLVAAEMRVKCWLVHTAAHGEEALEVLGREAIDIVVTDIYMPVMNGIRLRDTVRQDPKLKAIPFLFISAKNDEMTLNAVRFPEIEGFFQKGKPIYAMFAWVTHLTTPIAKRIGLSPGDTGLMR
jgi:CheY-like chemotaxis protein